MNHFDLVKAQKQFNEMYESLKSSCGTVSESQEAILFAKALQLQTAQSPDHVKFCSEGEFFVSSTLTGYAVTGYYDVCSPSGKCTRTPFNITVRKIDGVWYPSVKYVGADTRSGSNFIAMWLLISIGCTLVGLISYFIMKAAIGF